MSEIKKAVAAMQLSAKKKTEADTALLECRKAEILAVIEQLKHHVLEAGDMVKREGFSGHQAGKPLSECLRNSVMGHHRNAHGKLGIGYRDVLYLHLGDDQQDGKVLIRPILDNGSVTEKSLTLPEALEILLREVARQFEFVER